MKRFRFICFLSVLLVGFLISALKVEAAVGRFIQVQGRVDLLKQGQLPATPAAVNGEVNEGDIVRTKSASRAQIQFVDDTVITIGPESRIAIEKYLFDAKKGERQAVVQVFLGLVKTAVSKLYQVDQPDFILKSHTAVSGVRGTEWLTYLLPNRTDIYVYEACGGKGAAAAKGCGLEVRNISPKIPGAVLMKSRQYTQVRTDQPPTPPVPFTPEDVRHLERLLELLDDAGASTFPLDLPPVSFRFPKAPLPDKHLPPFADGLPGETDPVRDQAGGLYVPPRVPPPVSSQEPGFPVDVITPGTNQPAVPGQETPVRPGFAVEAISPPIGSAPQGEVVIQQQPGGAPSR